MPTNVEIKLRVDDLEAVEQIAVSISDSGPELLVQEDVFFPTPSGRLKLRKFADGAAELIAYHREDSDAARESTWLAYPTSNAKSLESVLAKTLGTAVIVRKRRTLYLVGNTRIHLDRVESLGTFVELEVVLDDDEDDSPKQSGAEIAEELIARLGLESSERMSESYADLLHNG